MSFKLFLNEKATCMLLLFILNIFKYICYIKYIGTFFQQNICETKYEFSLNYDQINLKLRPKLTVL